MGSFPAQTYLPTCSPFRSQAMSSPVILVTGGYDHKIRYWDAASGVCTRSVSFGESQINCLQISLDKTLLAAGGNPMINLYDINSNDDRPLVSYEGHSGNVTGLGFHRDQRWLYSCSEDGSVRIWDPRTNTTSRRFETQSAVNTVVLHPTEAELISGDADGNLKVWDLAADKMREEFNPAPDFPIRSLSMSLDGTMMAAGSHRGRLFVYSISPEKKIELTKEFQAHDDYLLKVLISNNNKLIATTSSDKTIKLHSTATWQTERVLSKHQRWVWDAAFSADSMYLLSASSDQSAKLWDLRSGEVVRSYVAANNTLALTCVALHDITLQ